MTKDIVRALGFLTLGSRMKRIGERLQADAQRILDERAVAFQPGHYPFVAAIDRFGPLTIGDLAAAIGVTQPAVTRAVAQLVKLGVLSTRPGASDQRQRIVSLTKEGRRVVAEGKRTTWPLIESAVRDLCAGLSGPLLGQLAAIEDGLAVEPLPRRAGKRRKR